MGLQIVGYDLLRLHDNTYTNNSMMLLFFISKAEYPCENKIFHFPKCSEKQIYKFREGSSLDGPAAKRCFISNLL